MKYAVGRVDTTARVWLGTSMACAECHDHKYDPISNKEYYQFFSFFFDTPENGLDAEELNPVPRITLESPEQRAKAEQLDRQVSTLEAAEKLMLEASKPEWDRAEADWVTRHREGSIGGWTPAEFRSASSNNEGSWIQGEDGNVGFRRQTNQAPSLALHYRTLLREVTWPPP